MLTGYAGKQLWNYDTAHDIDKMNLVTETITLNKQIQKRCYC